MRWSVSILLLVSAVASAQSSHLADIRQLTHGGQNAEAYWSPDGKRLIFQTTRSPYGCDQIFVMNADGSDQHLVSTGKGRTTCGYFLARQQTHRLRFHAPRRRRLPGRTRSQQGLCVGRVLPATTSFSPPTTGRSKSASPIPPATTPKPPSTGRPGNMVYTSLASRDLDLVDDANRRLRQEASHDQGRLRRRRRFLARRQEAGVARQLSEDSRGYGPLQVAAGRQSDGADEDGDHGGGRRRQQRRGTITNFGCASFAPTFTPDGKKILFSSNKHQCDSRNFELYLMNVDGTGLEQVTSFGRIHFVPRILARRQDAGLLLRPRRKGALRVQYLHRSLE